MLCDETEEATVADATRTSDSRTAGPSPGSTEPAGRTEATAPTAPTASGRSGTPDGSSQTAATEKADRRSRLATRGKKVKAGTDAVRVRIAALVWLAALLAAMVLAGGALLFALDANMDNWLVSHAIDLANRIDGPFANVFEFHKDHKGPGPGPHDHVKEHLVNWGLAAVAYLVVGRVLDRIIRP